MPMNKQPFDASNVPLIGKTVGREKPTESIKLAFSTTEYMWALISYTSDGKKIGVAAMGPIESFPVVMGLMERAGATAKSVKQSPIDAVVMQQMRDKIGDGLQ